MSDSPALKNKNVLISGAGIAGPALAYWLDRYGFTVTVVEEAPAPRTGGYIFGLDGRRGVEVLQRMGVWARVEEERYEGYDYMFVDAGNKVIAQFDVAAMTREVTGRAITYMRRADLARILFEHAPGVEYVFGDAVRALTEDAEGVDVDFTSGKKRRFDVVVGADGLHSGVRAIAFGEESRFTKYMGHCVAAFTIPDYPSQRGRVGFYTMPRKSITLYDQEKGGTIAVFTFRQSKELEYGTRDTERQKALLAEVFANESWEVPRLLQAMQGADDFFFDSVSQIRMDTWSRGRVTLVGDAAYCPTLLTGYGSQLALVGAYVLAGELKAAGGDHRTALAAYEREMRPFVEQKQRNIRLLRQVVPGSAFGLWVRNQAMRLMRFRFASRALAKATYGRVVQEEEITLRDYEPLPVREERSREEQARAEQ